MAVLAWKLFLCAICLLGNLISTSHAYFESCSITHFLTDASATLRSPYYPQYYNAYAPGQPSSCRYEIVTDVDYVIDADCYIDMNKSPNSCSTEYFYVARDGDRDLRGAENFCGTGTFKRTSIFRKMTLAYISGGSWGNFTCTLTRRKSCDCGWSVNTKIVNGVEVAKNQYPAAVALLDKSTRKHFCGATIIHTSYILTAAHCTVNQAASNIRAVVGEHNLAITTETPYTVTHDIAQKYEHPSYNANAGLNDVALLRTTVAMEWTRGVGPACLTTAASTYNYENVAVLGWGTTSFGGPVSNVLQKVELQVLPRNNCQTNYAGVANISASHLCTYDNLGLSRDSCQYDSGGSVIYSSGGRQYLVGCISFGMACGAGGYSVGVNTRINSFVPWIDSIIGVGARCQR